MRVTQRDMPEDKVFFFFIDMWCLFQVKYWDKQRLTLKKPQLWPQSSSQIHTQWMWLLWILGVILLLSRLLCYFEAKMSRKLPAADQNCQCWKVKITHYLYTWSSSESWEQLCKASSTVRSLWCSPSLQQIVPLTALSLLLGNKMDAL